jgi:hypothetical protein
MPLARRSLKDFKLQASSPSFLWLNKLSLEYSLNVCLLLRPGLSSSIYNYKAVQLIPLSETFHRQHYQASISTGNELCSLRWLASHNQVESSNGVRVLVFESRSEAHDSFLQVCDACSAGMGYRSLKTCEGFVCAIFLALAMVSQDL